MPHPFAFEKPQPADKPLPDDQIAAALVELPGWNQEGSTIVKEFKFDDHHDVMAFVNALAWISHRMNHHPDVTLGYNQATVRYSTHDAGGITRRDLQAAAKVETLFEL